MRATCSTQLIVFYLASLIMFGEKYKQSKIEGNLSTVVHANRTE